MNRSPKLTSASDLFAQSLSTKPRVVRNSETTYKKKADALTNLSWSWIFNLTCSSRPSSAICCWVGTSYDRDTRTALAIRATGNSCWRWSHVHCVYQEAKMVIVLVLWFWHLPNLAQRKDTGLLLRLWISIFPGTRVNLHNCPSYKNKSDTYVSKGCWPKRYRNPSDWTLQPPSLCLGYPYLWISIFILYTL
jgi:hypothetical protein